MRIEIRSKSILLDGYVNAVGRDSRPIPDKQGKYIEQVVPGAFQRTIDKAESIELRLNHKRVLGSTADGVITLYEDPIGLRAICEITDPDVTEKAKKGELRGWSFGFFLVADHWDEPEGGPRRRYLDDIDMFEVSIIDNTMTPAYIATTIETRGEDTLIQERRGDEFRAVIEDMTDSPHNSADGDPIDYAQYDLILNKIKKRGNE